MLKVKAKDWHIYQKSYPLEGTKEYDDYYEFQRKLCKEGCMMDGVFINPYLYWHLNFWNTEVDYVDANGRIQQKYTNPLLRDNDWLLFNAIWEAETNPEGGQKGVVILGARRIAKSTVEASYIAHGATFDEDSQNVISGTNAADIKLITDKISKGLNRLPEAFQWQRVEEDWKKQVSFGLKDNRGIKHIFSQVIVRNLDGGSNEEAIAGTKPRKLIIDEAGKGSYLRGLLAARPGFNTPFGWACSPIVVGCVCAGTKVYTNEGKVINIEDLKIEDGIIGYDGNTFAIQTIKHMNPVAKKPCYRIITTGGNTIECSEDHPFLSSNNRLKTSHGRYKFSFVQAKDLKKGDYLSTIQEVPVFGNQSISNARLYGLFLGDGYFKGGLLCVDDEVVREYIVNKYETSTHKSFLTKEGTLFTELYIKNIRGEFTANGFNDLVSVRKRLPDNIHTYNKESLAELLAGLFDADGSVYYNKKKKTTRISFTNTSWILINDMKYQLLKFGIHSSVYMEKASRMSEWGYQTKDAYTLYVSKDKDVRTFIENIPLLHSKKVKRLSEFKSGNRDYHTNGGVFFLNRTHRDEEFVEEGTKINGFKFETVKVVESIGDKEVYNLSALENKTYIANGFITHNTSGDMEKYRDLKELFENPDKYNFISFPNATKPEKQQGLFIGAKYRLEGKEETTLAEYLGKPEAKELQKIPFFAADEEKALSITEKELEKLRGDGDTIAYLKEKMYFPKTAEDAFLNLTSNRFNTAAVNRQIERLKDADIKGTRVELEYDGEKIKWKHSEKAIITEFPVKTQSKDAPIVIYEFPVPNAPWGLYTAGCLLPNEKVLTDKGFKSISDVTLKDKLVNKEGDLVDIVNLQTRSKVNETVYSITPSGSFRSTTFTKEHPIYSATPILTKAGKKKVIYNTNEFNLPPFDFKEAKDIKVGDILKYPNPYYKKRDIDFSKYWEDNTRVDFHIKNPLHSEDFWWFVGLFLGYGCSVKDKEGNYRNGLAINAEETFISDRVIEIIDKCFGRVHTIRQRCSGCIEISFNSKTFGKFFTKNFGKYAEGKYIPEWVKFLPNKLKACLILGYLDSYGCVYYNKPKKLTNLDFVSISLELLEGIQDLFLGLGITSNINLLRDISEHTFKDKVSKTKKTYQLRTSGYDTEIFIGLFKNKKYKGKLNRVREDRKIITKQQRRGFWFEKGKLDYVYATVAKIEVSNYTGAVHNFECDTHTYISRFIATHNCDPYRQSGDSKWSTSLGSVYIYKRMHNITGDGFQNMFVASYTARPDNKDYFNEQARLLIKFYNAYGLVENDELSFIDYMKQKNEAVRYLSPQPAWLKTVSSSTSQSRDFGVSRASDRVRNHLHTVYKDYIDEIVAVDVDEQGNTLSETLGVTRILDSMLLEETKTYSDDQNSDRIIAAELALVLAHELDPIMGKVNTKDQDPRYMAYFNKKRNNRQCV